MKNHTRVTSKGQITLPAHLREAIGIETGDSVAVSQIDEHTLAIRVPMDIASIRQQVGPPSLKQPLTKREQQRLNARRLIKS